MLSPSFHAQCTFSYPGIDTHNPPSISADIKRGVVQPDFEISFRQFV